MWIKRDDMSGLELSGNKVRKLEFLMAEALEQGTKTVVTIGGQQSNHARCTAAAARLLGMDCSLLLRMDGRDPDRLEEDPGLVGNLMFERLIGTQIHTVTKAEYQRHGSGNLVQTLSAQLEKEGAGPVYSIPVGGSNALSTWGYLDMVKELEAQQEALVASYGVKWDVFVTACGSGGTTGGLALGVQRSPVLNGKVYGANVCDSGHYFYGIIDKLYEELGAHKKSKDCLEMIHARNRGYAVSSPEELAYIKEVALHTGILLDPVYTGKALFKLKEEVQSNPEHFGGKNVLFLHTGGAFGLYEKADELLSVAQPHSKVSRLLL